MKKNILIVLFLTISLIAAFSFISNAQVKHVSMDSAATPLKFKELIADETWLTYNKTGAKIVTTLESVFQDISLKWGTEFKKITITYKVANGQQYKEYVILISEQTANNIKQWAKKNL